MSILLNIDGTDRTRKVKAESIRIDNILTNRRDTAQFSIVENSGDTYKPTIGNEVVIYDGATKIFGGTIVSMESRAGIIGIVEHVIQCQDYTRLFDHRLVPNTFTDHTVDEIISFLKDNYFPEGFTINNVDAPVTISYVGFNYKPLAVCIEELAKAINYDWYIDYDKDLHFFAKETVSAPFGLTDTNGNYQYDSLTIRRDNSQIRNTIIVRGGEYLGSQLTTDILTNGTDAFYPLPYKFADFAATLTGTNLNLGIDYIDNPDNFDALHNFQEKIIKFKEADKPSASKTLSVSGKPYLPVIIRYRSESDIASMVSAESTPTFTSDGIYEYLIKDKSINSREGALQRARAEILAYATTLSEGDFVTNTSGLRAGMAIIVQSDSRGLNETFIINKVTTVQWTKDAFLYKVSLITTRTMDLIDVLRRLLLQSTEDIEINPNEQTDVIISLGDSGTFVDSLGTFSTHGSAYKWGPDPDAAIANFSTWS